MPNGLFGTRGLKLLCLVLMLIGCNPEKQWQLQETTGHLPDLRFSLMSDTGQAYQGYIGPLIVPINRISMTSFTSAAVYVFDSQGHARLLVTPDDTIETVANDLRHLLDSLRL